MTMEQLPPKGVKREQAILELGKEDANGELLLQLVNTEKGRCKTAAQKALAQLEYAPAAPLWAKLVKGKWMGSHILSESMPPPPHCGPSWSKVNGWAAISCRMPAPIVYRSRSLLSS